MKNIGKKSELSLLISEGKAIPLICVWCNKIVGIIKSKVAEGERALPTHGICKECSSKSQNTYYQRRCF